MRWTACASLIVPFRILELLAPCARKRVGDGAWSPLPSVGGMPAVAGLARGESCGLDVDTCAMLIVCRSSWTATSSSASQPRKPHSRTSRTSVRNGTPEEVDDAWVSAPNTEKAARFASAEAMRWLEWGARSYHDFALGLALLLIAAAIVGTTGVPRPIAYLMGISGLTYLVQGWVVGSEGFSGTHTTLILVAWAVTLAWMIWLVVVAWRMRDSDGSRAP
jgi:hypothetical protein